MADESLCIRVDEQRCDGCGLCLSACPFFAIGLEPRAGLPPVAIVAANCIECEICLPSCPAGAIGSMAAGGASGGAEVAAGVAATAGAARDSIWILAGPDGAGADLGRLARKVAGEWECRVTGIAVRLAAKMPTGTGSKGSERSKPDWPVALRAADEVWTLDLSAAVLRDPAGCARVLADAAMARRPRLIIAPFDAWGRQVLPALAATLDGAYAGPIADLEVSFGSENVSAVATTHGGRVATRLAVSGNRTLVAAARPTPGERKLEPENGRWSAARPLPGERDFAVDAGFAPDDEVAAYGAARTADGADASAPQMPLTPAEARGILFGAGPDLGGPKEYEKLARLAAMLGAGVGATRECVEAGWAPADALIDRGAGAAGVAGAGGTAGAASGTLTPLVYLAFGVDGSPGHDAAIAKGGFIVAVTTHTDAPLALGADYVLPAAPAEVLDAFLRVTQEISPEK